MDCPLGRTSPQLSAQRQGPRRQRTAVAQVWGHTHTHTLTHTHTYTGSGRQPHYQLETDGMGTISLQVRHARRATGTADTHVGGQEVKWDDSKKMTLLYLMFLSKFPLIIYLARQLRCEVRF